MAFQLITPAKLLRDIVVSELETVASSQAFVGNMPNEPDSCVVFYDSGGGEQNDRLAIDEHRVQLKVRGSYTGAYAIAQDIKFRLQSIEPFTLLDGFNLIGIWVMSNIAQVGRDNQSRTIFVLNFMLKIAAYDEGGRLSQRGTGSPFVNIDPANVPDDLPQRVADLELDQDNDVEQDATDW